MIHKFEQGGLFMVVDVNSGAVHVVDELVYDILDHYPEKESGDVIKVLGNKYDSALIADAIGEIENAIENDKLEEWRNINITRNAEFIMVTVEQDIEEAFD